jgi:hypothetical protein
MFSYQVTMSEINRYSMMLEALAELKPEVDAARRAQQPVPDQPALNEVLAEFGPMPAEALFLGVASDGLPVLLNLHDPFPGPILLCGDAGTGKTAFLQTIASAAAQKHSPEELQFGVLTSHPDEWRDWESIPNNVGVFPLFHKSAEDFILSLASWAHGNKTSQQSVLLLLDDLEAATNLDFDAKQNLRWLFLRGPSRRVWPINTLNPSRMENILPWLDAFRTRIFGTIQNPDHVHMLDADSASLNSLNTGTQFTLREGDNWLKFWIPSVQS